MKIKISSAEMSDTFHIIKKKKEERAFDVSQDGYFYNRRTTTKEFPAFFEEAANRSLYLPREDEMHKF